MTEHSFIRARERFNLNRSAAKKNFDRAFKFGLCAEQMPAKERKYMTEKSDRGKQILLYGEFLYIFAEDESCITMFRTPPWFRKKSNFDGKEKIRNPKKYFNRYNIEPLVA